MKALTRIVTAVFFGLAGAGFSAAQNAAALYGVAVKYGPPIPPPTVTLSGTVTDNNGNPIVGAVVRNLQNSNTSTDNKGQYIIRLLVEDGQTVQLVIIDRDGEKNGGDFASAIADIHYNTKNESTEDDAIQTRNFSLSPKIK